MDVNKTTIAYLRVLIIGIGSTIILMVVESQGIYILYKQTINAIFTDRIILYSDIRTHMLMYVWYNMCTFLKLTGNCCLGHVLQFCLHPCSCHQCMCSMCSPTIPTSNATSSYPFPKGWARSIVVWLKPKFKEPMVKGTVSSPQKPGHCAHFRCTCEKASQNSYLSH